MIQSRPNYTTGQSPLSPRRNTWVRGRLPVPLGSRTQGLQGLGQGAEQKLAISSTQIAGGTLATVASTGGLWGMSAAVAVPVIGAAVAGITFALVKLFGRLGPKQKVATTHVVDTIEPILAENRDQYLAGPRTRSSQEQALANFDAGWQWVKDHCLIPEMGDPGRRCVEDRQSGGQWDWFAYYRDPIANDPEVRPDPIFSDSAGNLFADVGQLAQGNGPLLVAGGLVLAALLFFGGGRSK